MKGNGLITPIILCDYFLSLQRTGSDNKSAKRQGREQCPQVKVMSGVVFNLVQAFILLLLFLCAFLL